MDVESLPSEDSEDEDFMPPLRPFVASHDHETGGSGTGPHTETEPKVPPPASAPSGSGAATESPAITALATQMGDMAHSISALLEGILAMQRIQQQRDDEARARFEAYQFQQNQMAQTLAFQQ